MFRIHRSVALAFILATGMVLGAPVHSRAQDHGQNVLLVIADDMGVETIGAYEAGDSAATTPTIDRLIREGVRFENAWAYPLCTPYRASVLTGRYGFRTGVGNVVKGDANQLPLAERILPEVLDEHSELGVAHAAIGKWHLSALRNAENAPNEHGFGHYAGSLGVVADYFAWDRTVNGQTAQSTGYATSVQVDDALAWIGQQDGPWFTYLAFSAPHAPFHRPPDALHTVELPAGELTSGADARPYFLAAIEAMDRELGRLLDSLDPRVRANTTVIFMGDNGSPGQAAGAPFDRARSKGTLYQGGVWTPLIIAGPGVVAQGRTVAAPVSSVDLFMTVLELLGIDEVSGADPIDSVSLLPYLENPEQDTLREWSYSEQFNGENRPEEDGRAIRDREYKYIRFSDGREAFFDLARDPYEARDLWGQRMSLTEQARLWQLQNWMDELLRGDEEGPAVSLYLPSLSPRIAFR